MIALAVQLVCGAVLLVFTVYASRVLARTILPIYAVVSVSGLARSFLQPARTALGAEIVPRETYTNAVTWRSSLWQFAAVIGPAAGGILYGFSGARLAYTFETILCAIAVFLFGRIAYTRLPAVLSDNTIGE